MYRKNEVLVFLLYIESVTLLSFMLTDIVTIHDAVQKIVKVFIFSKIPIFPEISDIFLSVNLINA